MTTYGFLYSWTWFTPYAEPTDGFPHVHARVFVPVANEHQGAPGAPAAFLALHGPGDHRFLSVQAISDAPRQISTAGRAALRRKILERRERTKNPLFADEFIAEKLAAHTAYYAGGVDPGYEQLEAAKQAELARWQARTDYWRAHPLEIMVYMKGDPDAAE